MQIAEGQISAEVHAGTHVVFALADETLSKALRGMHAKPGYTWSLQELAESVGMSRSLFAVKFKEIVGTSPMEYLTRWRMLLACSRLEVSGEFLSELASSLGYRSESAFGKAFKRVIGCSPRQYKSQGLSAKAAARGQFASQVDRRVRLKPLAGRLMHRQAHQGQRFTRVRGKVTPDFCEWELDSKALMNGSTST